MSLEKKRIVFSQISVTVWILTQIQMYFAAPPGKFGEEAAKPSLGHSLRLGEKQTTLVMLLCIQHSYFSLLQSAAQVLRDEDCPSMIVPSRPCEWFYFLCMFQQIGSILITAQLQSEVYFVAPSLGAVCYLTLTSIQF